MNFQKGPLDRWTRFIDRRRAPILLAALACAVVAGIFGLDVAKRLGPAGFSDPGSPSIRADAILSRYGGLDPDLVVLVRGVDKHTRAGTATLAGIRRALHREPLVRRLSSATSPATAGDRSSAAPTTDIAVFFRPASEGAQQRATQRIEHALGDRADVAIGGPDAIDPQLTDTVERDVRRAELLALPLLFLLAFLFFRGLVSAILPPLVGGLTILGTFFVLRLLSGSANISVLSLNMITAVGLGLAVDYSLFMVTRYREEIARSGPTIAALRATMESAGRTVLFSALTIAAVMSSLLVFPQTFLSSMGLGGLIVALISAVVSLLVLPAGLALLGSRVNALSPRRLRRSVEREARPLTNGFWYRLARFVTNHARPVALLTAALLLALALPALHARFAPADASVLPHSTGARQVFDAASTNTRLRSLNPTEVLLQHASRRQAKLLARRLASLPGAAKVSHVTPLAGGDFVIRVQSRAALYSSSSQELVHRIRAQAPAGKLLVTGPTAEFADLKTSLVEHLPLAALVIVIVTMLALFVMTGSVVLGVKALIMNILTLGAVYGLLVLIFQDGRLETLLAFTSQSALDTTAPMLLFAAIFALATDYGVFLLARVKEVFDAGGSNDDAVAIGQERTGRAITSAAGLFCVAVGAFATSSLVGVKETSLGLGLAVLIDATLVRALLMPALMHVLGDWNWWAPGPLRRLHDRFGLNAEPPSTAYMPSLALDGSWPFANAIAVPAPQQHPAGRPEISITPHDPPWR